jgi:transposase
MAAAAEPLGPWLASDVHPGQRADDGLYTPLIQRVRQTLGRTGLLYCGDTKMAALATRAELVAHGDHYLLPLSASKETPATVAAWQAQQADALTLVWSADPPATRRLLGAGYTVTRTVSADVEGRTVTWEESVHIVRSLELARRHQERLQHRMAQTTAQLWALTPPPKRGRKQFRDRAALEAAIATVLEAGHVADLLRVTVREDRTGAQPRWVVTAIDTEVAALQARQAALGWRYLATDLPDTPLTLPAAVHTYRAAWGLEHQFHQLKDHPLGITPLQVRREDQLYGLVRLLTLALRVLTLLTSQVRQGLARDQAQMAGLYPHSITQVTAQPTGVRLLRAIAAAGITLTTIQQPGQRIRYLSVLPPVLRTVLAYCQLPITRYTDLADLVA